MESITIWQQNRTEKNLDSEIRSNVFVDFKIIIKKMTRFIVELENIYIYDQMVFKFNVLGLDVTKKRNRLSLFFFFLFGLKILKEFIFQN